MKVRYYSSILKRLHYILNFSVALFMQVAVGKAERHNRVFSVMWSMQTILGLANNKKPESIL